MLDETAPKNSATGFSKFNLKNTESKVKDKARFSKPIPKSINVLVNYWEIKPSLYEAKLQDLALRNIRDIATYTPWAHVETDIHHSLKKFLRAAANLKFNVRLFVMPELGVGYPNVGVPKDLLSKTANLAIDRHWRVIYNHSAPNIFALPSFSSPEVLKRFGNYLIKIGATLSEVFHEAGNNQFCEIVVSNSFFNYYRGPGQSFADHGDFSASHVMAFRDFLDREYRSADATLGDNEQFKTQLYENYNRHRYFSHVEKLLREKTDLVFNRKGVMCTMRHIDLFNPECCPEAAYQCLITELLDFKPSVQSYYRKITAGGYRGEVIHLANGGIFRRFSEQGKSFLVLASLIHSGEVSVDFEDLFKLPRNFQRKLQNLVEFLESGSFVKQSRISYVSASKFSMEEKSFGTLSQLAPGVIKVVAGLGAHSKSLNERLVFMDPKSVLRLYDLVQLFSIAQTGKVVAIPAPMSLVANYTAEARHHFDKFRIGKKPIRTSFGVSSELYDYHLGQVLFYDPVSFWTSHEEKTDHALFFKSVLGLAEVNLPHTVSDTRIHVSAYSSQEDPSDQVLFLINPTEEEIQLKLGFSGPVLVSPLEKQASSVSSDEGPLVGKVFELSVPPLGVLSMRIAKPGTSEVLWT